MRFDREFLRNLSHRKQGIIGKIITDLGFLKLEDGAIKNLHLSHGRVERIVYTIWFLERQELISLSQGSNTGGPPDFDPSKFKVDEYLYERLSYINEELLKKYWGKKIYITPKFYEFINNNYRTQEDIDRSYQITLSVGIAILSSILTALATYFIPMFFG